MIQKIIGKKGILIIFGGVIFYAALVLYSDALELAENFQTINPLFIPLILFTVFIAFLIRGMRQYFLLKSMDIQISIKENFKLYFAGLSMLITPAGSGEMIKSYFLKEKHNIPISKTVPLVPTERFHDLLAIVTLIGITLIFFDSFAPKIVFILGGLIVLFIFIMLKKTNFLEYIQKKLSKKKFFNKFLLNIDESKESIQKLSKNKILLKSWGFSILAVFIEAVAVYFSFLALDLSRNFFFTSQIVFSSGLIGALTLLPGGLGVTEGSMIGLLVSHGEKLSISTVLVLLIRFTTLWFGTILGFIFVKLQK